jgi:ACGX-repeat protein
MGLKNLYNWGKNASSACGSACGAGKPKAACGSACGAGKPKAACGSACGAGGEKK